MKLYTFEIPAGVPKTKLLSFAKRMLPQVPEYVLREAFQKRDVKLNGERVSMEAYTVAEAEVKIYTRDWQPKQALVSVIYEDDQVLIVFKPAGVSCEKDSKGGLTLPAILLNQKPDLQSEPLLCHRLDNPTEGLIVLAKNLKAQLILQEAFRNHQISKEYTCIVLGTPKPAHAVLEHYLVKDAKHSSVRVVHKLCVDAKPIVTEYTVVSPGENARVNVRLHTGRTHQIRAHMAYIGHPLLGDDQYGDRDANKRFKARRLMLCSTTLRFQLEGTLSYMNDKIFTCTPTF